MGQPMTARSSLPETAASGAAVLEIDRFEWTAPDRIELVGSWIGLRGRRFIRPTLILKGEGESKRLLALLEHKPWAPQHGEGWIAAFAWQGDPLEFESATLHVASGIDVELPPPQVEPGKEPRFQRPAAGEAPEADPPPKTEAAEANVPKSDDGAAAASVPGPPEPATPAAQPQPEAAAETATRSEPDPVDAVHAELDAARAEIDRLRYERDGFRRERDAALEQLRKVRGEFERERQTHERALADARAHEREVATKMLAEGAEMRAALKRQREIAYQQRDNAKEARDEAIAACNEAL